MGQDEGVGVGAVAVTVVTKGGLRAYWPAMSAEEWARLDQGELYVSPHPMGGERAFWFRFDSGCASEELQDPHGVAALCLHGQPFGFTRGDVLLCRGNLEHPDSHEIWTKLADLADRIEALLPPEE